MSAPLIVVNCKTYARASGIAAEALAVEMQAIDTNARLVLAASALDIASVASAAPDLEVWAQHLDPVGYGSNTGRIHPKTAIERGATGTLSNHAERKVPIGQIDELLAALPPGFDLCACAADPKEAEALAHLAPPMIAVEPPELIGGHLGHNLGPNRRFKFSRSREEGRLRHRRPVWGRCQDGRRCCCSIGPRCGWSPPRFRSNQG